VLDAAGGAPVATIETTIDDDADAGEVVDRLKVIYRMPKSEPESG
jgi:hypothetical protein